MSFFKGRFDTVDSSTVDDSVKDLYRIRDNDKHRFKNKLSLFIPLFPSRDSRTDISMGRMIALGYVDPLWEKMNETERIENGLPSKFMLFQRSQLNGILSVLFLSWAMVQYSKIFYPSGVILKYQRRESLLNFLAKRSPIVIFPFYLLYVQKFYTLNYRIDYFSEEEEN